MDHDMGNIRENLKKWLKDTVPNNGVNGSFDEEGIKGSMNKIKGYLYI